MKHLLHVFLFLTLMYQSLSLPVVVNTWPWPQATDAAWDTLVGSNSPLDAVVDGCTKCEEDQCDGTVGFGGSPDENGETTLDAMVMNGTSMDVGSVGCLRRVKEAIKVARYVLDDTKHTLLVGELATRFAVEMGFTEQSLSTEESIKKWKRWKEKSNCQPNFWCNVKPDPTASCGPYHDEDGKLRFIPNRFDQRNHDTIGMIAINSDGNVAVGTSTNGANHKIPGRVGDSPIAGAGAYADDEVGGAVATGDGDVMMRFLPSFTIVEMMRNGMDVKQATQEALKRITKHYPNFEGALVAVDKNARIGASCHGFSSFHYCVRSGHNPDETQVVKVDCQ